MSCYTVAIATICRFWLRIFFFMEGTFITYFIITKGNVRASGIIILGLVFFTLFITNYYNYKHKRLLFYSNYIDN